MHDDFELVDGRFISTEELMDFLDDAAEAHDCSEDLAALLYSSILRMHILSQGYRFFGVGLVVTNAMWFAGWMGWL